jgi:hypothetical protein
MRVGRKGASIRSRSLSLGMVGMLFAAGGVAALAATDLPKRTEVVSEKAAQTAAMPAGPSDLSCAGGEANVATIQLVPDAVVREGGRERIEYRAQIKVNEEADIWDEEGAPTGKKGEASPPSQKPAVVKKRPPKNDDVGVAWETDIVDDRGNAVQSKLAPGAGRLKRGELKTTQAIAPTLSDGYYAIRARAAVVPPDGPATTVEAIQYLQVSNGRWLELNDQEWRSLSRITLATVIR